MVSLSKCIECGGAVSSTAPTCPHCKTASPHGVPCDVCKLPVRKSDGIQRPYNDTDNGITGGWYHAECLKKSVEVFREVTPAIVNCPVCNAGNSRPYLYNDTWDARFPHSSYGMGNWTFRDFECESCGHLIKRPELFDSKSKPYCNCKFCKIILNKSDSVEIGWGYFAHQNCCNYRPAEVAESIAASEQNRIKEKADKRRNERRKEREEFFNDLQKDGGSTGCLVIFGFGFGYLLLLTKIWLFMLLGICFIAYSIHIVYMAVRPD
jgi:hypothetical protein